MRRIPAQQEEDIADSAGIIIRVDVLGTNKIDIGQLKRMAKALNGSAPFDEYDYKEYYWSVALIFVVAQPMTSACLSWFQTAAITMDSIETNHYCRLAADSNGDGEFDGSREYNELRRDYRSVQNPGDTPSGF